MASSKKGAALGLNFARIVQQMNISREFISDKKVKVVSHAGFPYEAYNGNAVVTPWSLLRMVEFSRGACFHFKSTNEDRSFLDSDRLYKDYLNFIVATKLEISPQLYDLSVPKSPLDIHVELDNVGKTSFGLKTSFFLPGLIAPVCESVVQSVFVDLKTRKPSTPPDWWVKKFSSGSVVGKPTLKVDRLVAPQSGFLTKYQVRINASDLDPYWHANWTNYVRFSYDAFINHAVTKHGYSNIGRSFRKPKSFSVLYSKEANLNDVLDVDIWKTPGNANLFKFQFVRGSEVICQSEMELFPHVDE